MASKDLGAYIYGADVVIIRNFSLDIDQYMTASSGVCVELVDYHEKINTVSGTYFSVDGTVISGTFTSITVPGVTASGSAYRMCYDPIDDFSSLMGPTEFKVHAVNGKGVISEEDYYLTYGYKINFYNSTYRYIDFGYQNKVVVRASAENLASCPKESAEAVWFESRPKSYFQQDLGCSIVGLPYENKDLSAHINPLTAAYYYGRVCRLVVNAKDFAGNEMEPFILVYTIEEET